jgi:diaminopimelate epimerase
MNNLKFTKMHGLGNDFVEVEESELAKVQISRPELTQKLCDRRLGVGADGLMIIIPKGTDTDLEWDFYNSDGTVAEMCGNGMRCFAKYVFEKGITTKNKFSVKTLAGVIIPEVNQDGTITVNMGNPIFEPSEVPVVSEKNPVLNEKIVAKNKEFVFNAISMGNPHCVIFSDKNSKELALEYGKAIEHDSKFPKKTNVEFVEILSKNEIKIDVWERGCGITQACGTGACASAVAAILNNLTNNEVVANLPGGQLKIKWDGSISDLNKDVFMKGTAEFVFSGEMLL